MKRVSLYIAALILSVSCVVLAVNAASFVDVPEEAYYAEAAERMAEKGILTGYGDGYYYGNHNVTRAQMAVVACRLLDKEDEAKALAGKTEFNDVLDVHAWATGYINYAVANGIIIGDGDGNFRPDDNVKYEEAVKILVCTLGLDEGVKIDPTDWSKEYIEAADKAGLIQKLTGKKGEAMLRSDVAVLCDSSVTVLETKVETEATTTTKKSTTPRPSTGTTVIPSTTTATTTATTAPEPVETTTEATTVAPEPEETTTAATTVGPNETPIVPAMTTANKNNANTDSSDVETPPSARD